MKTFRFFLVFVMAAGCTNQVEAGDALQAAQETLTRPQKPLSLLCKKATNVPNALQQQWLGAGLELAFSANTFAGQAQDDTDEERGVTDVNGMLRFCVNGATKLQIDGQRFDNVLEITPRGSSSAASALAGTYAVRILLEGTSASTLRLYRITELAGKRILAKQPMELAVRRSDF
jgi:hypothetical protein